MSDNLFIKKINYFNKEQAERIFENNQRFFSYSKDISDLKIAKPINFVGENFVFERLANTDHDLSYQLHRGKMWDKNIFFRVGKTIGKLHGVQGDLTQKIYLHGDFVPHNIIVAKDLITIFDIEPPGTFDNFDYFFFNFNYVDLASFIFFTLFSHFFKTPWKFFHNKSEFVKAFLLGYCSVNNFVVNKKELNKYLLAERKKWLRERRHSWLKKTLKYVFVLLVFEVQLRLFNILE